MKTIIERGASWTLEETKLLLALWGQDLVQRQQTNLKRTKEVYDKIAEKFTQNGFDRTSDQVRTRVFNMIAEYRRILKDPSPERIRKCIFFEALHKIYLAKHMDDVKSALDDYEPEYLDSPTSNTIVSGDVTDDDDKTNDETTTTASNTTSGRVSNAANSRNSKKDDSSSSNTNTNTTTNNNDNNHNSSDTAAASATPTNTNDNCTNNNNNNNSNNKNDLHEENTGTTQNDSNNTSMDGANSSLTNLINNMAGTSRSTTSDGDSNVKHFKIRTSNNEVMLLKVIDDGNPSNKKVKMEPFKGVCQCDSNPPRICHVHTNNYNMNNNSNNTTNATPAGKHQSLLMPNAGVAGPSTSASTSSTPGAGNSKHGGNNAGNSAYISINNTKIPFVRSNGIGDAGTASMNGNLTTTPTRIQPTTATVAGHHQLYQAPVNTFDVTSSALLIDRMFAHLSRESENMREWIALEKERLALERAKKAQETEREIRRERVLIDTLTRFQEQWISFIQRLDPRIVENAPEPPPELKFSSTKDASNLNEGTTATTTATSTATTTAATTATATTTTTNTTNTSTSQQQSSLLSSSTSNAAASSTLAQTTGHDN